jgi:hypothetical protein
MSYENRALAAYYTAAAKQIGQAMQPGSVEIETHDGFDYVVLRNVNGVLAVYRITTQAQLKAMKRWPKTIS